MGSEAKWIHECINNIIPLCTNAYTDIPGAPVNVQVTNITSSTISLSWSPPLVSETLRLAIYSYTITCSRGFQQHDATHMKTTDGHSATFSQLVPLTQYNCCVAVNSENGPGVPACLSATTGEQFFMPQLTISYMNLVDNVHISYASKWMLQLNTKKFLMYLVIVYIIL